MSLEIVLSMCKENNSTQSSGPCCTRISQVSHFMIGPSWVYWSGATVQFQDRSLPLSTVFVQSKTMVRDKQTSYSAYISIETKHPARDKDQRKCF